MRLLSVALTVFLAVALPSQAPAQNDQTLADIRQELNILYVDIQRLKRELSTTGAASGASGGGSLLERVDLIEAELTRLTSLTENLQNRINRIVADGTNRIGDLEFRLVELEGGDLSQLGETTTLGGPVEDQQLTFAPDLPDTDGGPEMAVGEQLDFDIAKEALDAGSYQEAAVKFTVFTETYPIGPLTGEAHFWRGEALQKLGDTANAARAYLESFSGSPDNPRAAEALYRLGLSLRDLGQANEACVALQQVGVRYPDAGFGAMAREEAARIGCN